MKTYTVTESDAGRRLDLVLVTLSNGSRTHWQQQIRAGAVSVNGKLEHANYLVDAGDVIKTQPAKKTTTAEVIPPDVPVIFEDNDVIVIDKPAGILVHNTTVGTNEPTIASFAATKSTDMTPGRQGIVHRLDRDTSGVMILAKTTEAREYLMQQFKDRLVEKDYIALVEGHLRPAEAVIDLPVGRKPDSARYVVDLEGKPSQTGYKVEEEYKSYSLISAFPKTGRTHQIRVHFSHLGHPLAGDKLYGAKPLVGLSRQFLHAHHLTLVLPGGKKQTFTAELPPELLRVLETLRNQV